MDSLSLYFPGVVFHDMANNVDGFVNVKFIFCSGFFFFLSFLFQELEKSRCDNITKVPFSVVPIIS